MIALRTEIDPGIRPWRWWRGLGAKVLGPVGLVIIVQAVALSWLATNRLETQLVRSFESKGEAIALAMATATEQNLSGDIALVQAAVDENKVIFAVKYIFVIDDRGRPYVHTFAPVFPAELAHVNPIALGETFEAGHRVRIAEDVVFHDGATEARVIDVAAPVAAGALGVVHVGMDMSAIASQKAELWAKMLPLGAGVALAAVMACLVLLHVLVMGPVRDLTRVTARIVAEGDLTQRIDVRAGDEVGELGLAFGSMVERLRAILSTVTRLVDGVADASRRLSATGATVSSGVGTVLSRVGQTSASMSQNYTSLRAIGDSASQLHDSAERASSTIVQMAATNQRVAENMDAMAGSVDSVGTSVEQMATSIQGIAVEVERLQVSVAETGSATSQMNAATAVIQDNASRTSSLSDLVASNASVGVGALERTIAGIRRIHESSQTARSVIADLGRRVGEIEGVLDVIVGVAEQTNLLALNASIIAAQVGEQGRGFAIVASQIKELAQRTSESAVEIEQLIRDIQARSHSAVSAMSAGAQSVEEGVQLGDAAAAALTKIFESANTATVMVKAIAAGTAEQTRGSKHISALLQRIQVAVQHIATASNDQATRSREIATSTTTMRSLTEQARRSSHEQAEASKHAMRAVEQINAMASSVNHSQREQAERTAPVLQALETIRATSDVQSQSMVDLEEVISSLQEQAKVLHAEVKRFRL